MVSKEVNVVPPAESVQKTESKPENKTLTPEKNEKPQEIPNPLPLVPLKPSSSKISEPIPEKTIEKPKEKVEDEKLRISAPEIKDIPKQDIPARFSEAKKEEDSDKEEDKAEKLRKTEGKATEEIKGAVIAPVSPIIAADPGKAFLKEILDPRTTITRKRELMMEPLPKSIGMLECTITRDKSGITKKLYPKYDMTISSNNVFLMASQKMQLMRSAHYLITVEKENMIKKAPGYLGKLRSNLAGTDYNIFTKGERPGSKLPEDQIRSLHGSVIYEVNTLGNKGPRKMTVLIPSIDPTTNNRANCRPLNSSDHLINRFNEGKRENMIYYKNKEPKWVPEAQAFILDFNGRVAKPSIKNFQLVFPEESKDETVFMQFGRVEDHLFHIDIQYPLSLFQAFGIALTSFDYNY